MIQEGQMYHQSNQISLLLFFIIDFHKNIETNRSNKKNHMNIINYKTLREIPSFHMQKKSPQIGPLTYIDKTAVIIGDVTIGKNCGIFPQSVIRGDQNNITIDDESNIQDGCIIHVDSTHKASIGKKVSVGHGAIIHGAPIKDACIIGMHATILNGAVVKKGSIIGANALVTQDSVIPENSLVLGIPGKVVKQDDSFYDHAIENAETYTRLSKEHLENKYARYRK